MRTPWAISIFSAVCILTAGAASASTPPVILDSSEIPELEPWGRAAANTMTEWYPRIAKLLHSEGYEPPKAIYLKINNPGKGVAGVVGYRIGISASWIKKEPGHGVLIHELVHVVQDYRGAGVGWLTEGIADYIRWGLYEKKPLDWFPVPRDPAKDYHQSYRVAAGFLYWLETRHSPGMVKKLNAASREKRYSPDIFKKETGTGLDDLWAEYRTFRRNPATSGEKK